MSKKFRHLFYFTSQKILFIPIPKAKLQLKWSKCQKMIKKSVHLCTYNIFGGTVKKHKHIHFAKSIHS